MIRGLFVVAVLVFAAPARAQDDPELSAQICGKAYSAAHPLSWESIRVGNEVLLAEQKFAEIGAKVIGGLRPSPERDIFAGKAEGVFDEGKPCCEQFALKDFRVTGVRKRKFALFDKEVLLDDCGPANERADQLDELRYAALDFVKLGRLRSSPFQARAVKVIESKEKEYDRFLFEGFPMFPWEALANSALLANKDIVSGPPLNQVVLFHPSAGAEIQTGLRESRLNAALAIEPIGWVHYPSAKKHRTWWGVSALTTFRNDMGLGVGGAARYDHFMAGIVWHDSDNDRRLFNSKPFIFIGVDLYQFAGKQIRRYETYREKVKEAVTASPSEAPR